MGDHLPIIPWLFLANLNSSPLKPSYASRVSTVSPQPKIDTLLVPTIKGGLVSIQISKDSYQRSLDKCTHNLVGRVLLQKGNQPWLT
ncbi:hypothetical protein C1H46_032293 [Malus baccata]|uniref:Uncharacterized protein n=1 Tax=Malus baccata TaxID=106549 RepID=A0A540L6P0_MALBA|nr:hypothetical protein C1H46_032293 [Malus baccata]